MKKEGITYVGLMKKKQMQNILLKIKKACNKDIEVGLEMYPFKRKKMKKQMQNILLKIRKA